MMTGSKLRLALLAAALSSSLACLHEDGLPADDSGTDEADGDDEGDEWTPTTCPAPCAIVKVASDKYLYEEIWAVPLGDADSDPGTPQQLFAGGFVGLNLSGPTPWGSLAITHDHTVDQLALIGDSLELVPLLPGEFTGSVHSMRFGADDRFAILHETVLFGSDRIWSVDFDGSVATGLRRVDPSYLDSDADDEIIVGDGVGFTLSADTDRLYYTALHPDFVPARALTDLGDDVRAIAGNDDHLVAIVESQGEAHLAAWSGPEFDEPVTLAGPVKGWQVELLGPLVSYRDDAFDLHVADMAGNTIAMPYDDEVSHRWLRENVLLVSHGEQGAWDMIDCTDLQPAAASPITGEIPVDERIDRLACDGDGRRCIFARVSALEDPPSTAAYALVDVSGSEAGPSVPLLDDLRGDIHFFADHHAVIIAENRLHIVDLQSTTPMMTTIEAEAEVLGEPTLYPEHGLMLFVTKAGKTTERLWRVDLDGSHLVPLDSDRRWLDSDGWLITAFELLD